jgi:general secretion pathway protein I
MVNVKLAKRDLVPLHLRGRAGEGETGNTSFIVQGGTFAMPVKNAQHGFTLLETLVALAVLAIALGAILRTAGAETRHTEELRTRLLADWVAQNRLALHAANGDWIPTGIQNGDDTQAGIHFLWTEEISATANPSFRRIEVRIYAPEDDQYALRKLTGYLVQQRRQ